MEKKEISGNLDRDAAALRALLPAQDILTFAFTDKTGRRFLCVFADALTDKDLLAEQALRPLRGYAGAPEAKTVAQNVLSPEVRTDKQTKTLAEEVLAGNPVLLWEGADEGLIVGTKKVTVRAVTEPPTDVAIKGPREGFIEDVKTNTSLVRRRFKTGELQIEMVTVGRRSATSVAVCWLEGTCRKDVVDEVKRKLEAIDIDAVPDSSYLTRFLSERPYSLVKQVGTTEKPDIFCAKLAEGRAGLLVDGSPIALTVPYMLVEDFQSSEDYFVPAYRATFTRLLRLFALLVAIYLPAFYVAAQLFKLQLLPVKLLLTIAGSIRDIPLSPSLEMLLVLLVLEVLNEASIRMPKYVGMALSVVGALVLGETAVSAGFVSTPAIIIVAFSGIGLYAVPNLIEETSVLRLAMLLAAGSVGTYGIILVSALCLVYLVTTENFGVPLGAPFAPFLRRDLRDTFLKYNLLSLKQRPSALASPNKRRQK
ncbi:MAG TPA: spore germination protein [Firmicutes bacterium]|nr:spore germination protein [Bacillota bacterium]